MSRAPKRSEGQVEDGVAASEIVHRTADMIPTALLHLGKRGEKTMLYCYLPNEEWPAGNYPTIEFGSSLVSGSNFSKAHFDQATLQSLVFRFGVVRNVSLEKELHDWKPSVRPSWVLYELGTKNPSDDGLTLPLDWQATMRAH